MPPATAAVHDGAVIAESRARPDVFRAVFDRHYERVRRYAWARIGVFGEDVAAEAFAIAFARRERYDVTRADALPWLLGIATNLIRRHHREEQRRLRLLSALGSEREPRPAAEPSDPGLARALAQLHRRDREVLVLFAIAELSYAEIAEALDLAEGTVRSRLHRARRILQEVLPR